jgi:hypothetical protein
VLVVRPQPGQAMTMGVKARRPMRLQDLLRDDHFLRARLAVGSRRER